MSDDTTINLPEPIDEERFEKLPKYVQDHIESLTREAQRAVDRYNEHQDSQTPTRISVGDSFQNPRFLNDNVERLRFVTDADADLANPKDYVELSLVREERFSREDEGGFFLQIHGSSPLIFRPQAANVLRVKLDSLPLKK